MVIVFSPDKLAQLLASQIKQSCRAARHLAPPSAAAWALLNIETLLSRYFPAVCTFDIRLEKSDCGRRVAGKQPQLNRRYRLLNKSSQTTLKRDHGLRSLTISGG